VFFHKILHKSQAGAGLSRSEKNALNSMLRKFLFHFNLVTMSTSKWWKWGH
jgi:hypothetical protein